MASTTSESLRLQNQTNQDLVPLIQCGQNTIALAQLLTLAPPKKSIRKKIIPLLVSGSFLLGACSAIDASQIPNLQGSIGGIDEPGMRSSAYSDDFNYTSGFTPLVDQAKQQYSDSQIQHELRDTTVKTNIWINGTSGNVNASVARRNQPAAKGLELTSPWTLTVNPTGDGQYQVEIVAQECVEYGVQTKCTAPVSRVVSGQMDITAPSIALSPLGVSQEPAGLLVQGQIQDGQGSSGIRSADLVSCDNMRTLPLSLNEHGQFAAVIPPQIGDNCFVARSSDAVGNSGTSGTQTFAYDMAVSPVLQLQPDGKIVIAGSAQNNLFPQMSLTLDRCGGGGCNSISEQQSLVSGTTFQSPPVSPATGDNMLRAVVRDIFGNSKEGSISYSYEFSLNSQAGVQEDGSITVVAQPKSNQTPNFTVAVSRCDGTGAVAAKPGSDGSFIASGITPKVGDNCMVSRAFDAHGNIQTSESHVMYGLDSGLVNMQVEYKDKKAVLYLFGNPPPNIDVSSLVFAGAQPDWKDFNKQKEFSCAPLGDLTINNEKWKYSFACQLPANAGDAVLRFDFYDKYKNQYSVFYPAGGRLIADLRDKPTGGEIALFLAPYLAGFAATVSSGMYASRKAYLYVDERKRRSRTKKIMGLTLGGKTQEAEDVIRQPRKMFKVSASEAAIYREAMHSYEYMRRGQLVEAAEVIQLIDAHRSPALGEVKAIMLNSIVESVNARLEQIEKERHTHMLSQGEVVKLTKAIQKLSETSAWHMMDPKLTGKTMTYLSSFHVANQAYCMSSRDFVSRHEQICKGDSEANRVARRRMVELLTHWRQFSALEEFIKQVPSPEKKGYSSRLLEGQEAIKNQFLSGLWSVDLHELKMSGGSQPPYFREFLKGIKLTRLVHEELLQFVGLREAVVEGRTNNSFSIIISLMKSYPEDRKLIDPYIANLSDQAVRILENIVSMKDPQHLGDREIIALSALISSGREQLWWSEVPQAVRFRLEAAADELLMVSCSRNQGVKEFGRLYGQSRMTNANGVMDVAKVLTQWKDYTTALSCIEAFPNETEKRNMQEWFEREHIGPLRTRLVTQVRAGMPRSRALKGLNLPPGLAGQCEMLWDIEETLKQKDYRRALTLAHGFASLYPGIENGAINTLEHLMANVQAVLRETVQSKNPTRFMDGRLAAIAVDLGAFQKTALWAKINIPDKALILNDAKEIQLIARSFTEPLDIFIRSLGSAIYSSPTNVENFAARLVSWKNIEAAAACISLISSVEDKRAMEARFQDTQIEPLRRSYQQALNKGISFTVFFNGYRFPASLKHEFIQMEQINEAERKNDTIGLLESTRGLILANNKMIVTMQPTLEAALKKIHDEWESVIQTKDLTYFNSAKLKKMISFFDTVRNEPWWKHQLVSGFKDQVMSQWQEIALITAAREGITSIRDFFGYAVKDSAFAGSLQQPLCEWGYYDYAYTLVIESARGDEERKMFRHYFDRDHIAPLKKAYLDAMTEDFTASSGFLAKITLSKPHQSEFKLLRETYSKFLNWVHNEIPLWKYPNNVDGDLQREIMQDISNTCRSVLFERNLPYEEAIAVTKRWYDTMYFIDGPFVPQFLGLTGSDVAQAKKDNDYYPLIARTRKALMSLLNTLDSQTTLANSSMASLDPQKRQQVMAGFLIHGKIMEWFKPLRTLESGLPVKKVKDGEVKHAPVSSLTYTETIDASDLDKAYVTLWKNWMWELFNNKMYGESKDVIAEFSALNIKPVIYYTPTSKSGDKAYSSNPYII